MPPAWASSRIKLNQMFYKHKLHPPADIIESASFLATLVFMRERAAIGFLAGKVARHFEGQQLVRVLPVKVPFELPPVGLISLAGRNCSPSTQQLIDCLHQAAKSLARTGT